MDLFDRILIASFYIVACMYLGFILLAEFFNILILQKNLCGSNTNGLKKIRRPQLTTEIVHRPQY